MEEFSLAHGSRGIRSHHGGEAWQRAAGWWQEEGMESSHLNHSTEQRGIGKWLEAFRAQISPPVPYFLHQVWTTSTATNGVTNWGPSVQTWEPVGDFLT